MKLARKTYEGKVINHEEIPHQHLSNILWFNEIFYPVECKEMNKEYEELLQLKFDGVRLSYKPRADFQSEIYALEKSGMLVGEGINKNVVKDGKIIGILILEDEREDNC